MKELGKAKVAIIALLFGVGASQHGFGRGDGYSQIVAKAQADLNAGNAARALAEGQQAIKASPSRWEAYVVAGGALQLQHQYDLAISDFSEAVKRAPEAKKAAVRTLLQKAVAEGGTQSNSAGASSRQTSVTTNGTDSSNAGPSYADTVAWITANITRAGLPQDNRTSTSSIGQVERSQERYSFTTNSCNTFTVRFDYQSHTDQLATDRGTFPAETTEVVATYNFDMSHVAFDLANGGAGQGDFEVIALDGKGQYHWYDGQSDWTGDLAIRTAGDAQTLGKAALSAYGTTSGDVAVARHIPFRMPGTEDLPQRNSLASHVLARARADR